MSAWGIRHDPGHPHLNERGSRASTSTGTLDRSRRERDRGMVLSDVAERVRAGCIRHMAPGRMPVGALSLMVCGLAVGRSLSCPRCTVVVAMWVDVCERCRSAGRHQRPDEQHTHNPMDHHFYLDQGVRPLSTTCLTVAVAWSERRVLDTRWQRTQDRLVPWNTIVALMHEAPTRYLVLYLG